MSSVPRPWRVTESGIASLLTAHRDGVLVAVGDDGFRVPLPQVPSLQAFRTVEVSADRTTMVDLVVPADAVVVGETWDRALADGAAIGSVHLRSDPERLLTLAVLDAREQYGVWLGLVTSATEAWRADGSWPTGDVEETADDEVHRREQLFHRLAESLPSGVLQVDGERRVVFVNGRLAGILGTAPTDLFVTQVVNVVESDRVQLDAALDAALESSQDRDVEVEVRHPETGQAVRCAVAVIAVPGPGGTRAALLTFHPLTGALGVHVGAQHPSSDDPLTGCLARGSILAALGRALGGELPALTGVVDLDLDEFTLLNDTFGAAAGDEMLVEVAGRIRDVLRDGDCVGRIGADEFLVVCPASRTRTRRRPSRPGSVTG